MEIRLEWDSEAEVWISHVPVLNNLSTYGKTLQEVTQMTQEAVLGYVETAEEVGKPLPFRAEQIHAWFKTQAQTPVALQR